MEAKLRERIKLVCIYGLIAVGIGGCIWHGHIQNAKEAEKEAIRVEKRKVSERQQLERVYALIALRENLPVATIKGVVNDYQAAKKKHSLGGTNDFVAILENIATQHNIDKTRISLVMIAVNELLMGTVEYSFEP